jgi:hypothetical protein
MDRPVGALRRTPDPAFGRLTLGRIVDHRNACGKPFLIGHYGGLIVQMLLGRGLGAAGISINPGPAAWNSRRT